MRSILITGALACGSACAHTTAALPPDGWTAYSDATFWQASDAVPVSQLDGDWNDYSPRAGRNVALMRNRFAAGVEKNRWRLGLELRQEAWLRTDRDSLDAYHLYQQQQRPAVAASFALQATYFSWRAQGLRIGYTFEGPHIAGRAASLEISGAAYGKQRLRKRSVSGTLRYAQADTVEFAASHVDTNSRMTYPFMGEAPTATGTGLSLAATLPLATAWTLRVQGDDIATRLRWKNLPLNTESLSSDSMSYDENGYVNYRPLLSGRKRQLDRNFRIPRYTAAALDYWNGDWGAGVQVARYAGETIPTVSLSRQVGALTLRANVETRFDSAGLGVEAGNFRLLLQADTFKLDKAKTRSLQLHYHVDF